MVVRYDEETKTFDMEIDGNIVKMLTASHPTGGRAYAHMGSSLKLVAGACVANCFAMSKAVIPPSLAAA